MKSLFTLLGLGVVALGCASTAPRELVDARAAYNKAQQNPGAQLATVEMHDAQVALAKADKKFADDGDEQTTRDAAYIAQRRAVGANATANAMQAMQQQKLARADLARFKESMAVATRSELGATKDALTNAQSQAESERRARAAADKRAQEAFDKIAGLKSAQSDRGLVLTLSGSVLFASGKSTLLPTAQQRLNEVATALKEEKRSIVIVGHTDSQGADDMNMALSKARADAVRTYLTSHGLTADRVRSEGLGETQPIADNGSPEGRANNRRVELILEHEKSSVSRTAP